LLSTIKPLVDGEARRQDIVYLAGDAFEEIGKLIPRNADKLIIANAVKYELLNDIAY
jgi:hypothetical protein